MSISSSRLAVRAALGALVALPVVAGAQLSTDKYQVHGYLTQGYGASDSLPIVGIGSKGTGDYRAAALQLRATPTKNDAFVVQLANRRMGESLNNKLDDPVALQWAYYQRRLPGGLTAKVGRAPMPRGVYNEVRKVGTLLPFYRAPYGFYGESYETVDGGMLARTTKLGAWELESSAFGGTVDFRQASHSTMYAPKFAVVNGSPTMVGVSPAGDSATIINERAKKTYGGQLWLATPITGLRVGAGATRFDLNAYQNVSGRDHWSVASMVQGSVDGNFTHVQLRSEWEQLRINEFNYTAYYVQGGVKLTSKLTVNAQREQTNMNAAARPSIIGIPAALTPRARVSQRLGLDHTVGLNYAVRPNTVVKLEGHDNRGTNFDQPVAGTARGKYFIASLALSF